MATDDLQPRDDGIAFRVSRSRRRFSTLRIAVYALNCAFSIGLFILHGGWPALGLLLLLVPCLAVEYVVWRHRRDALEVGPSGLVYKRSYGPQVAARWEEVVAVLERGRIWQW
ncbi:MAG: hypothetical protein FJ290_27325, partial [Planctomycetes bacterium]|nr:hypothetical protein [Planctomycetota bacterium]